MNKGRTFPVEVLTDEEVERLMAACSRKAPTGIRNRALIALLFRTGLRITEALSLQPKDLDPAKGTVRVLRGKGGKARTVGMDAGGFALVERWLSIRPRSQWVFCTLQGGQVSDYYVRNMLPRIAERAGIQKRVHPHGLRHTHAATLADSGVPIHLIAGQLGHSNIGTTSRYIDHIAPGAVIAAVRAIEWSNHANSDARHHDDPARRMRGATGGEGGGGRERVARLHGQGRTGPLPVTG